MVWEVAFPAVASDCQQAARLHGDEHCQGVVTSPRLTLGPHVLERKASRGDEASKMLGLTHRSGQWPTVALAERCA